MSPFTSSLVRRGQHLPLVVMGMLAALGFLSLSRSNPAHAQGPGVNLTALYNQVQTLQATVNAQQTTITNQQTTINALKALTSPLSLSGPDFTITGVNVHIVSGSGRTDDNTSADPGSSLTGLGNLIIGYNATGNSLYGDVRTGSHNLILGDKNSYSSYGGLVAGTYNAISNLYASVSGGFLNKASGDCSSISGGSGNKASGNYSSAIGGWVNTASGNYSSTSGGAFNTASGDSSTVSGGQSLSQGSSSGWMGGGYHSP